MNPACFTMQVQFDMEECQKLDFQYHDNILFQIEFPCKLQWAIAVDMASHGCFAMFILA